MAYATQAKARYPDCTALESLCRHAEDRTRMLRPGTVRLYRRQYASAVILIGRYKGLGNDEISAALSRILDALEKLKGKPDEKRTSSKKFKDPPTGWQKRFSAISKQPRYATGASAALHALFTVSSPPSWGHGRLSSSALG